MDLRAEVQFVKRKRPKKDDATSFTCRERLECRPAAAAGVTTETNRSVQRVTGGSNLGMRTRKQILGSNKSEHIREFGQFPTKFRSRRTFRFETRQRLWSLNSSVLGPGSSVFCSIFFPHNLGSFNPSSLLFNSWTISHHFTSPKRVTAKSSDDNWRLPHLFSEYLRRCRCSLVLWLASVLAQTSRPGSTSNPGKPRTVPNPRHEAARRVQNPVDLKH